MTADTVAFWSLVFWWSVIAGCFSVMAIGLKRWGEQKFKRHEDREFALVVQDESHARGQSPRREDIVNTAEILRAAAERVRQGWCQNILRGSGNVCGIGAIDDVLLEDRALVPRVAAIAERALKLPPGRPGMLRPLAAWNDAWDQTAENVAAGLEYAALVWEQEQQQQVEQPATETAACPS